MKRITKTRFAPSPTGPLHLGGARIALLNQRLTDPGDGAFILRIEDTDRIRSQLEFETDILEQLEWLGIRYDEGPERGGASGPYRQTEATQYYRQAVQRLLEHKHAYPCPCSTEDISREKEQAREKKNPWKHHESCPGTGLNFDRTTRDTVIRFRSPRGQTISWQDGLSGEISFQSDHLEDFIIQRSDQTVTYLLTVVVDDARMNISTVIRGADHISNTPKQILLFRAMGVTPPEYIHFPLLTLPGGKKLSKREGDHSVRHYRQQGFLPRAITKYLLAIGRDDRLADDAPLTAQSYQASNAAFDELKLLWYNRQEIQNLDANEFLTRLGQTGTQIANAEADQAIWEKILPLLQPRADTLLNIKEQANLFFAAPTCYDEKALNKIEQEKMASVRQLYQTHLKHTHVWRAPQLEQIFRTWAEHYSVKLLHLVQPIRIAISGTPVSPPLFETLEILGPQESVDRMRKFFTFIDSTR